MLFENNLLARRSTQYRPDDYFATRHRKMPPDVRPSDLIACFGLHIFRVVMDLIKHMHIRSTKRVIEEERY